MTHMFFSFAELEMLDRAALVTCCRSLLVRDLRLNVLVRPQPYLGCLLFGKYMDAEDEELDWGDEGEAEQLDDGVADAGTSASSGRSKARGGGNEARGRGRGKDAKSISAAMMAKNCFICPGRKAKNSKFCLPHDRICEAIKYQAGHAIPTSRQS
jgi:hypothetical protein